MSKLPANIRNCLTIDQMREKLKIIDCISLQFDALFYDYSKDVNGNRTSRYVVTATAFMEHGTEKSLGVFFKNGYYRQQVGYGDYDDQSVKYCLDLLGYEVDHIHKERNYGTTYPLRQTYMVTNL